MDTIQDFGTIHSKLIQRSPGEGYFFHFIYSLPTSKKDLKQIIKAQSINTVRYKSQVVKRGEVKEVIF